MKSLFVFLHVLLLFSLLNQLLLIVVFLFLMFLGNGQRLGLLVGGRHHGQHGAVHRKDPVKDSLFANQLVEKGVALGQVRAGSAILGRLTGRERVAGQDIKVAIVQNGPHVTIVAVVPRHNHLGLGVFHLSVAERNNGRVELVHVQRILLVGGQGHGLFQVDSLARGTDPGVKLGFLGIGNS